MKNIYALLTLILLLMLLGCKEEDNPFTEGDGSDYTVSGTVTDQDGNALSGITVKAFKSAEINDSPVETTTTGVDGSYSVKLEGGLDYTIQAFNTGSSTFDASESIFDLDSDQVVNLTIFVFNP